MIMPNKPNTTSDATKEGEINSNQCESIYPFLKWLGGKRWLMPTLDERLSGLKFNRYIEPFLGGAATYFHLNFQPAFLSDINEELINTYIQVRDNPNELIERLKKIKIDANTYYRLRNTTPRSSETRAVRFLYLNRTAFSGVYRVNDKGQFNVPFGYYNRATEIFWKDNLLIKASQALKGSEIYCADFEVALNKAQRGDLVYCDPTYTTMHNNNGFRKYNERCFSWADQERLAEACKEAVSRGATVVISNGYHYEIKKLYDNFNAYIVERKSVLCPDSSKRRIIQEYLFISNNKDKGK